MRNPLIVPDVRELLQSGETEALREFFAEYHPARVTEIIEDLESGEGDAIFALLEPRTRAEVLSYIDEARQIRLVEAMPPNDGAALLQLMPHDDRADLVRRLDEDHAEEILRRLAHAEREDIRRLVSYETGTAGAVMTTDYATLSPDLTVLEATGRVRQEAPDRETINYLYVVDSDRKLLGVVSLRNLFLARPRARIDEIMTRDLVVARVDEDQESVAHKILEYDLIAIPVIDAEDRLVGIVTHDDAADILRQEQGEDFLRFGGVAAEAESTDSPYWSMPVTSSVKRRIGWLFLLFGAGTLTGAVIRAFNWVDHRYPSIDFDAFIPLLIGTGGNAGSQAVGTVIRSIALNEIQFRDLPRVLLKEALTGLLLGSLLGAVGYFLTTLVMGHSSEFGAVIALAVLGICVWANCVGALVPLLASQLGIDPAVVSAPLISTLVDATGLVIFYSVSIALLARFST